MNRYDKLAKTVNPECTGDGIKKILADLTNSELKVIGLRFGLDNMPKKVEEIAAKLGITEDQVKELEAVAIRKLRHPTRVKNALAK